MISPVPLLPLSNKLLDKKPLDYSMCYYIPK